MAIVTVCGTKIVRMPGKVSCPFCLSSNNVESVFMAAFSLDTSADSERLVSSEPPVVRCVRCEQEIVVNTTVSQRRYEVPAQVMCSCGALSDLHFSRDNRRIRIMDKCPYLPFLYCRRCKRKLVFPVMGGEVWRNWLFKVMRYFNTRKGVKR